MDVAVGVEEKGVVVNDLLEDEHELVEVHAIDGGVDALLEGAHGVEGVERVAEQEDGGVTAEAHGHELEGLQRFVFGDGSPAESFFEENDFVLDAGEAIEKFSVAGGGVDLNASA